MMAVVVELLPVTGPITVGKNIFQYPANFISKQDRFSLPTTLPKERSAVTAVELAPYPAAVLARTFNNWHK